MKRNKLKVFTSERGYTKIFDPETGESCRLHSLTAIAGGDDPNDVFSGDTDTHHIVDGAQGVKIDTPENTIVLPRVVHQTLESKGMLRGLVDPEAILEDIDRERIKEMAIEWYNDLVRTQTD